jgi:hypothetical protein
VENGEKEHLTAAVPAAGRSLLSPFPTTPEGRRFPVFLILHLPLVLLLAAGCTTNGGDGVVPVFTPVPTARVKPGGPYHALVLLPNQVVASVYLHFGYTSGRITVTKVGLVNHNPDKLTLSFTRTRVYVDDGKALSLTTFDEFKPKTVPRDFHILKGAGEKAEGKWLFMKTRFVSRDQVRGPTVVLFYTVKGHRGFVKVPYRAIWDVAG